MQRLTNKRILLGVTGSIAAYKSAELIRRLRDEGAEVQVIMTRGAEAFITALTLQAVSGHPVHLHLMDTEAEAGMGHIELARWADAILIAPTSADFMARLAQGRADDLLTAVCLAGDVPLALAPAMNNRMWRDRATQDNAKKLVGRGILLFGPDSGDQACGETGPGRMREVDLLVNDLVDMFDVGSLAGKTVLITAGPTREPIDPVRFISNHSSGKMGYAIAEAAVEAGARVILVSGPTALPVPDRVELVNVETANQMLDAVQSHMPVDLFIATAAVADYRPVQVSENKIKKQDNIMALALEKNPDILAETKAQFPGVFTIGFAAETNDLETYARNKLMNKGVEMIAANWVGSAAGENDGTFGSDNNALQLFWQDGEIELPMASKSKLARSLLAHIVPHFEDYQAKGLPKANNVVNLKDPGKPIA
ncbi:MAG: bifunctional phosphopantothenoylcysteine decarboxylase/phosphopantothenate--cysteine ligase CoaBC [Gammaproteobacteria bacterium]|nr:bifunctional phosphopantothenoylcysteine decarboxylase/phosphopantothenate--cysteine ligase CoaBC [Gammaproteobacteria bacterium]